MRSVTLKKRPFTTRANGPSWAIAFSTSSTSCLSESPAIRSNFPALAVAFSADYFTDSRMLFTSLQLGRSLQCLRAFTSIATRTLGNNENDRTMPTCRANNALQRTAGMPRSSSGMRFYRAILVFGGRR